MKEKFNIALESWKRINEIQSKLKRLNEETRKEKVNLVIILFSSLYPFLSNFKKKKYQLKIKNIEKCCDKDLDKLIFFLNKEIDKFFIFTKSKCQKYKH
jgi:hypothetical protein